MWSQTTSSGASKRGVEVTQHRIKVQPNLCRHRVEVLSTRSRIIAELGRNSRERPQARSTHTHFGPSSIATDPIRSKSRQVSPNSVRLKVVESGASWNKHRLSCLSLEALSRGEAARTPARCATRANHPIRCQLREGPSQVKFGEERAPYPFESAGTRQTARQTRSNPSQLWPNSGQNQAKPCGVGSKPKLGPTAVNIAANCFTSGPDGQLNARASFRNVNLAWCTTMDFLRKGRRCHLRPNPKCGRAHQLGSNGAAFVRAGPELVLPRASKSHNLSFM